MKHKLNPQVFVRAAENIDGHLNLYCCTAIEDAIWHDMPGISTGKHTEFLASIFKPLDKDEGEIWWEDCDQASRIIALLLCAEIVKDQNRAGK